MPEWIARRLIQTEEVGLRTLRRVEVLQSIKHFKPGGLLRQPSQDSHLAIGSFR